MLEKRAFWKDSWDAGMLVASFGTQHSFFVRCISRTPRTEIKNGINRASRIDSNFSWNLDQKKTKTLPIPIFWWTSPRRGTVAQLCCPNSICFCYLTSQFLSLLPQVPVRAEPSHHIPQGPHSSISLCSSCRMLLSELFPAFPTVLSLCHTRQEPRSAQNLLCSAVPRQQWVLLQFVSSRAALSLRSSPISNLCFFTIHCQWALLSPSEEVNYTSRYLLAHQHGLPANAVCLAHVATSLLTFIRVIFAAIPASGELPPAPFYKRVQACGAQELGQRKGACCLNQHVR